MVFSIAVTLGNVFFSSAVNLGSIVVFSIAVTLGNVVVFSIAVTLGNQLL